MTESYCTYAIMIDNTIAVGAQPVKVNLRDCSRAQVPGEDCDEPVIYRAPEAAGEGSQETPEEPLLRYARNGTEVSVD